MEKYSRVYFSLCLVFGYFREVAHSAKIKPTRKIPDIRYQRPRPDRLSLQPRVRHVPSILNAVFETFIRRVSQFSPKI